MNSYSQQETIKTNFYPHFVSETYQNWQTYNNDVFHLFPCDFTFKINWFRRRKWINAAADKIWRDGEALSHPSSENKALKQKQEIRLTEQMSRPDRQTQFASCQISFPDMWEFQGGVAASSVSSFSRPAVCSSWKVETGQRQVLSCSLWSAAHTVLFLMNVFNSTVVSPDHRHTERDWSKVLQTSLSREKAPYLTDRLDGRSKNVGSSNITRVSDHCCSSITIFGCRLLSLAN